MPRILAREQSISEPPKAEFLPSPIAPKTEMKSFLKAEANYFQVKAYQKNAENLFKVAHGLQLVKERPDYDVIQNLRKTESLDNILKQSATRLEADHKQALTAELPFQKAQAAKLMQEVHSPVTDQEVLNLCLAVESSQPIKIDSPAYKELLRRRTQGNQNLSIEQVKRNAQGILELRRVTSEIKTRHDQNQHLGGSSARLLLSPETQAFMQKTGSNEANLLAQAHKFDKIDLQRAQLAHALHRVDAIQDEVSRTAITEGRKPPVFTPAAEQSYQLLSPTEHARLQQEYKLAHNKASSSRDHLQTASAIQGLEKRSEYVRIQHRIQNGETLASIVSTSENNAQALQEQALAAELPYRQEQIAYHRNEKSILYTHLSNDEIIAACDKLEYARVHKHAIKLGEPGYDEIHRIQLEKNMSVAQIKAEAQASKDRLEMQDRLITMATALKKPGGRIPLDLEAQVLVKNRQQMGESIDQIIVRAQNEIKKFHSQKKELEFALQRVQEIPQEKTAIGTKKNNTIQQEDQQQIDLIRQKIQQMNLSRMPIPVSPSQSERAQALHIVNQIPAYKRWELNPQDAPDINTSPPSRSKVHFFDVGGKVIGFSRELLKKTLTRRKQRLDASEKKIETVAKSPPNEIHTFATGGTYGEVKTAEKVHRTTVKAADIVGDAIVATHPKSDKAAVANVTEQYRNGLISKGGQDVVALEKFDNGNIQAFISCADGVSIPTDGIGYEPSAEAARIFTEITQDHGLKIADGFDGSIDSIEKQMVDAIEVTQKPIVEKSHGGETVGVTAAILKEPKSKDTYMVAAWVGDPNVYILGRQADGKVVILPQITPSDKLDTKLRSEGHALESMSYDQAMSLRENKLKDLIATSGNETTTRNEYLNSGINAVLGFKDNFVKIRSKQINLTALAKQYNLVQLDVMLVSDNLGDKLKDRMPNLYAGSSDLNNFAHRADALMQSTDYDDGSAAMLKIKLN